MKEFFDRFKRKLTGRLKYVFIFFAIVLVAALIASLVPAINNGISKLTDDVVDKVTKSAEEGELKVHYFNVGQGDSEFIELPNGQTILIDGGVREQGPNVVAKIKQLGYQKIDYVIATHPHADHIGGLIDVYNEFEIKKTYMPNCPHTTKTYEDFLSCVENECCDVINASAGVDMINSDDIYAYFVAPCSDYYEKINNYSACMMLKYGENSFLFMGDAEQESEYEIAGDLTCDVIKVGHHGSDTSSSYNFVPRTHAKYAIISCGVDNDYGHPHQETLDIWKNNGATIFRTDLNGDITFTSNGKNLTYQNEFAYKSKDDVKRDPNAQVDDNNDVTETTVFSQSNDTEQKTYSSKSEYKFVVNTYRKTIHYPTCDSVNQMNPENRKYTNKSVAQLKKEGYKPCGNCHPSD